MMRHREYEPEPIASALVIGGVLSLLIVVVGLGLTFAPASLLIWDADDRLEYQSGVEFPDFQLDADELAEARAGFTGDPELERVDDEIDEFTDAYRQLNHQQFEHDPADLQRVGSDADLAWDELESVLEHRATDIAQVTGPEGFQLAGEPIFETCRNQLETLLDAVETGQLEMSRAIEDPPADEFGDYRKNCGNLIRDLLHHYELIDEDGRWQRPDGPELVDLLQRYRWVQILRGRYYGRHQLMSPEQLQALYRWRIEEPGAFPPAQRREYLREGRGFLPDDYDVPLAEARIDAAAAESPAQVRDRFAELVDDHPDNLVYQAIYDDL